MSTFRARFAIVAAAGAIAAGAGIAAAPGAGAHPCAQVRVYVSGSPAGIGSCHAPGTGTEDLCLHTQPDPVVVGTGAGASVCIPR